MLKAKQMIAKRMPSEASTETEMKSFWDRNRKVVMTLV